jgi:hypothetical protein
MGQARNPQTVTNEFIPRDRVRLLRNGAWDHFGTTCRAHGQTTLTSPHLTQRITPEPALTWKNA